MQKQNLLNKKRGPAQEDSQSYRTVAPEEAGEEVSPRDLTLNEDVVVEGSPARGGKGPSFNTSALDFLQLEEERLATEPTKDELKKKVQQLEDQVKALTDKLVRAQFL